MTIKYLTLTIALLLGFSLAVLNAQEEEDSISIYLVRHNAASAWPAPQTKGTPIAALRKNDTLLVLELKKQWYKIQLDSLTAFVPEQQVVEQKVSKRDFILEEKVSYYRSFLSQKISYDNWVFWALLLGIVGLLVLVNGLQSMADYKRQGEEEDIKWLDQGRNFNWVLGGMLIGTCYLLASRPFLRHLVVDGFSWTVPSGGLFVLLAWALLYILAAWLLFRIVKSFNIKNIWTLIYVLLKILTVILALALGLVIVLGLWYPALVIFGIYWIYLALTTDSPKRYYWILIKER